MPNMGKWLKQKKEQEKKARLQTQNQSTFSAPIGARFQNDTGFGPDNILQPNRPTAQFQSQNGPVNVHEGEQLRPGVGNNVNVIPQEQLIREEQLRGTPGFQRGGTFQPTGGPDQNIFNQTQNRISPINISDPVDPLQGTQQTQDINVGHPAIPRISTRPRITPQTVQRPQDINVGDPIDPNIGNIIPVNQSQQVDPINIPDPVDPNIGTGTPVSVTYDPEGNLQDPQVTYPTTQSSADPVTPDEVVDPTVPTPDESEFSDAVKFSLAQLRKMFEGGSPAQRAAAQRAIDNLKATQATERRVGAQQLAQGRVGGVEARTAQLVQARDAGSQLSEAVAQMGIGDLQVRENALQTMAQIGLQGQQLEQSADQWQQQFDFAKQKYGDQEGQRIFADINSGMTLDQIQEKYPDSNISQGDFDSMQNATPMSQWEKMFGLDKEKFQKQFDFAKEKYDFDKQMSSVNALIQQGGAENFEQASKLFKNMFGEDIDFSNALSEENSASFNDGMAQMSAYLASGMDWDQALTAMQKDGSFEKLGMMESDVESMYNQMRLQSNPLWQADQAYQDLVDSGVIDQEMKDQIMDVMFFTLSNPEGLEITEDKFVVKDADGNIQAEFDSQKKADFFLQTSGAANKGWTSGFEEGKIQLVDQGQGTGQDTGTGTQGDTNQQFASFESELPDPDLIGVVTQDAWVEAGKPKTWKEFQSANILGDIDSLLDKDGNVITKENIDKVFNAIQMQNTQAMNKFKMNSEFESTLEDIEVNDERIEGKEATKIRKELQKNKGKIFHYPGNKFWPEGDYVIQDVVKRTVKKQGGGTYTYTIVEAMNTETRKVEKIGLPIEW